MTQDLKLEPWQSEAEHSTSRSRRLIEDVSRDGCYFHGDQAMAGSINVSAQIPLIESPMTTK